MALNRRLAKELEEARAWPGVRELEPLRGNLLHWGGLLVRCEMPPQEAPPGALRFEVLFSPRHPAVPPRVTLRSPLRHPAVGPGGHLCQPLVSAERWAPHVTTLQVLQDLLLLLQSPAAPWDEQQ